MNDDAQQQSRSQTAGAVLRRTAPPAQAGSQPPLRGWPPAPPRSARPPHASNVDNTDRKPAQPAAAPRPAPGRPVNVDKKGIRGPRPVRTPNVDAVDAQTGGAPSPAPEIADFVETMPEMPSAPQPVPTLLAETAKGRAAGPNGPDPERVRSLREARKKVLAERARARGADPGAGSVASAKGGTRSANTQDQYLRRGRMLLNRYRRENGLAAAMDDVNPVEFVNWLLSLKQGGLKATTWRFYRQAGAATISGLPHHQTEAALAMLDADVVEPSGEGKPSQTKSNGPRRTSSLKEKRFPKNDFDTVYANLKYISRSQMAPVLMDWMQAGVITGLRPIEWRATELEIQNDPTAMRGRRAWLYVLNAKATNGRANGAVRTLDLSNVSDDALQAVARMSDRGSQWLIDGNYDIMQSGCSQLLYSVSDKVFSGRQRVYSLYSLRHQFIANMKSIARPEEVSALAGHVVTTTAAENYGKRRSAWPPEAIIDVVAPVPEEVSTVRQRLRFFEERIRIQRAAGLLKDQPSTGTGGDGDPEAVA